MPCSWIKRLGVTQMSVFPKLKWDPIPVNISEGFFMRMGKLILKLYMKIQKCAILKTNLSNVEGLQQPSIRTCYTVAGNEMVWCWYKKGKETNGTDTHTISFAYDKGPTAIQKKGKESSFRK